MLKIVCAIFLLVFVFSAGTIVGSHFKNQIEQQKTSVARSIRKTLQETANETVEAVQKSNVTETISAKMPDLKTPIKKVVKKISTKVESKSKRNTKSQSKKILGKYTVQVASFPSKALANVMSTKLKKQGYDTVVFPGSYKGQTWFRVGIGSYNTIGEANKKQRQLVLDKVARGSIISKIR